MGQGYAELFSERVSSPIPVLPVLVPYDLCEEGARATSSRMEFYVFGVF